MLASISSSFTSQVASHGVYAVFLLMAIDAVFPAASEIVMLYAGAVAAGVLRVGAITCRSSAPKIGFGIGAFIVMALAGTLGYFVGALVGWAIGRYGGRPLLERRGRWFHLTPAKLDRAERWFDRWGNVGVLVGRITPVVRSFVSIPAGVFEMPLGAVLALHAHRLGDLGLRDRRRGLRPRLELRALQPRLQVRRIRGRCRRSRCSRRIWSTGGSRPLK